MIQLTSDGDRVLLPVRVQPAAGREAIEGEHAGRLKVALTAPPEKGKANKALVRLLAKQLGLSRTAVALVSGQTSRDKLLSVAGMSVESLAERLALEGQMTSIQKDPR